MPRRMITPEIFFNEKVGSLPPNGRLLFIGIFSNADDDGRIKASPKFLKARIFPYDEDITTDRVKEWRDECHKLGLIRIYSKDTKEYLDIPGWLEHQAIRKDRYKPSTIPAYEDTVNRLETKVYPKGDNEETKVEPSVDKTETSGRRSIGEGRGGQVNSGYTEGSNDPSVALNAPYEECLQQLLTAKRPQVFLFTIAKGKWPSYGWDRKHIAHFGEMAKRFGLEQVLKAIWLAEVQRPVGNPLAFIKAILLNKGKLPKGVEKARLPTEEELKEGTDRFLKGG